LEAPASSIESVIKLSKVYKVHILDKKLVSTLDKLNSLTYRKRLACAILLIKILATKAIQIPGIRREMTSLIIIEA